MKFIFVASKPPLDLVFIMGTSGKDMSAPFMKQKAIVKHLLTSYYIVAGRTHVGIINNGNPPKAVVKIGKYHGDRLKKEIDKLPPRKSGLLLDSLNFANDRMFTSVNGARSDAKKSLIVFVNEKVKSDKSAMDSVGEKLKKSGINVIVIGLDPSLDKRNISAAFPSNEVFFFPPALEEIDSSIYPIVRASYPGLYGFWNVFIFFTLSHLAMPGICCIFWSLVYHNKSDFQKSCVKQLQHYRTCFANFPKISLKLALYTNTTANNLKMFNSMTSFPPCIYYNIFFIWSLISLIFLDPCSSVKCDAYKVCSRRTSTSYECVCQQCSSKYNLVCGSNRWTYASECHLRKYSCNNQLSLYVQSNGPCGKYPFVIFLGLIVYPKPSDCITLQARVSCRCRSHEMI